MSVSKSTGPAAQGAERFSIVILTWNRHERLSLALEELRACAKAGASVVVVDNGSEPPVTATVELDFPFVDVIEIPKNMGTSSRNAGIASTQSDFVVCLDDDVFGITPGALNTLAGVFDQNPDVAAVCFKVVDEKDPNRQINWCHDYPIETHGQRQFVTDEISEGAVSFRRSAIANLPLFPEEYFISHEGVAVAYQLMNAGYSVIYEPQIVVKHATAPEGRKSWRRYYYDTRNNIWLVAEYFPAFRGLRRLLLELSAMLAYSLRDGYFRYWAKGLWHGLKRLPAILRIRQRPSRNTLSLLRSIDRHRPSLIHKIRERMKSDEVRI